MKVFISWSGDTGRAIAEVLHAWLPQVIQAIDPYFSPDDISKGARWNTEIAEELENSRVGIVVVTRESMNSPWVMFEAGALSKDVGRSRVVPILFSVEPSEVKGPLVQFQAARFEAAEVKRVLRMINSEVGDSSISDQVLESAFDVFWPKLEKEIQKIQVQTVHVRRPTQRSERDLLEELLTLMRATARRESKSAESDVRVGSDSVENGRMSAQAVLRRIEKGNSLAGANMMGLILQGLDLSGANFQGANLIGADLTNSTLIDANLKAANLEGARLDGADLNTADISHSNLWGASMKGVENLDLVRSMDSANFYRTELDPANQKVVSKHNTLELSNYPDFFDHYLTVFGMSPSDLREHFLWTAHSYPGFEIFEQGKFNL